MICCRLYAMQPDASPPGVNIGSIVQALRGNSSRTLLDVRNGSRWRFRFTRFPLRNYYQWERPADVLNQVVPFEVKNDGRISRVHFVPMWDGNQDMSVALCQAMRTNKTVRALELCLNYGTLEERHLTAIEDSLLKNDTLQSFYFFAGHEFGFPNHLASHETIRDTFERILQWNMCLVEISIRCMRPVKLGRTVTKAIERNKRAWIVAKHLGQLNRSSAGACQNLGDIVLRRLVLCFFLANGCQEPPRQMLHIAGGLPVWRPVSRDVL